MPARSVNTPLVHAISTASEEAEIKRLAQLSLILSFVNRASGVLPAYILGPSRGSRKLSQARQTQDMFPSE